MTSIVLSCLSAPAIAFAGPPVLWDLAAPDPEDHHERPAGWDSFAVPELPPVAIASEYPLAAGFVPANAANFLANGMESFDYVVVHTMQGSYGGTISWFQNPNSQVSTHYVMRSGDGEVTQMVLDKDRGYHVGATNRYALGIEHEGFVADPGKWYTWAMYNSSARLTRWLTIKHDIPVDRDHIVGHVELPNQSHTDPGPGWNWTLYMALIHELVAPGEIRGVAVDRTKACTLTAGVDTVIKRSAMATALNAPEDLCQVAAGTQLQYWHARRDIDGHHRLIMPPGEGPCAGVNGLDADGYIIAAEFSALCPDEAIAAAGATLQLDGGAQTVAAADGSFVFVTGQGAHTVDASAAGLYEPASEGLDLAVYPGARLVIALDPVPAPDPSDTDSDSSDAAGETASSDPSGPGDTSGPDPSDSSDPSNPSGPSGSSSEGGLTSAGGESGVSGQPTEGSPEDPYFPQPALPEGYGQDDLAGCACRHDPAAPGGLLSLALGLLGLAVIRRRHAVRPDR
nr:peptidoglycan recognition family protein [Nannocystis sp.]